jgi:hypothetical protein
MYLLSRLFLFLTKSADQIERERDDAYLAEATDLYDLEFRLRRLDHQKATSHTAWLGHHG